MGFIDIDMDGLFQFKHCTIIRQSVKGWTVCIIISIQALYDYKNYILN